MRIKINEMMQIQELAKLYRAKLSTKDILDSIEFSEIEKYVRDKKLKNINGSNK
jgi:hypothetical protein